MKLDFSLDLPLMILKDMFTVGRIPLFILTVIFISAMSVVLTTHNTRQAITEKDQALEERAHLDEEWRNLILEESALSEHSRVQRLAVSELEMTRPSADKEVIIRSQ
jgi:cell division protein FtsL